MPLMLKHGAVVEGYLLHVSFHTPGWLLSQSPPWLRNRMCTWSILNRTIKPVLTHLWGERRRVGGAMSRTLVSTNTDLKCFLSSGTTMGTASRVLRHKPIHLVSCAIATSNGVLEVVYAKWP